MDAVVTFNGGTMGRAAVFRKLNLDIGRNTQTGLRLVKRKKEAYEKYDIRFECLPANCRFAKPVVSTFERKEMTFVASVKALKRN